MGSDSHNHEDATKVLVAFVLVGIGSLSTLVGAALVFTPFVDLRKKAGRAGGSAQLGRGQKLALAFALAFAAGVMIVISFTDILAHTYESFNAVEGLNPKEVVVAGEVDPHAGHNHRRLGGGHEGHNHGGAETGPVSVVSALVFIGGFVIMGLINMAANGLRLLAARLNKNAPGHTHDIEAAIGDIGDNEAVVANIETQSSSAEDTNLPAAHEVADANPAQLLMSGILTAVAIAMHNLPEGIVVFVGGLASPTIGAALCFATIVHNLPEGICIALPVCYGAADMMKPKLGETKTGAVACLSRTCCSIPRWAGFGAASLATMAEAAGGLIGYLALLIAHDAHSTEGAVVVHGLLFGSCGGIMIFVSIHDLLPLAHTYANHGGGSGGAVITSLGFFCGMCAMMASGVALSDPNDTTVIVAVALGAVAIVILTVIGLTLAFVMGRRHHHEAVPSSVEDETLASSPPAKVQLELVASGAEPKTAAI